jgi:hypothetical protein
MHNVQWFGGYFSSDIVNSRPKIPPPENQPVQQQAQHGYRTQVQQKVPVLDAGKGADQDVLRPKGASIWAYGSQLHYFSKPV